MITDTMNALPSSARVIVIGGGIGGCSAAYHLASLGVTDVLLLERSMLSSGTTWHSTGNMETYRADPLIFEMVRYAAQAYPRLEHDSGREIGWRNVGRVFYTDREDRWASMQTVPELGRARGIDIELLTPAGVQARLPIIDSRGLLGGMWVPSDARVNATDAVMAFSSAARSMGARICQDQAVREILVRDGTVRGVVTAAGSIGCDTVIIAAGLWSREIAKACGAQLPLYALEHQYLITKPHGVSRSLPLFLSYDDQLYGREEVGGLMIGSLDDDAIALPAAALPQNFSFALLNERWEQFESYMATAMRRFPVLRTAEIKMLLNGPESFTPDGQMLLGPVPGVTGLFAACGFNSNGIALAPAAGRFIAEWIVEGEPSSDVSPLDVRRFSPAQSAEGYLRERVTEIPGFHCRMHAADADYRTARNIRRAPLHAQFAEAGARFASVNAWERPLWIASSAASGWLDAVADEVSAGTNGVLVVDRSADVKYLIAQPAHDWMRGRAKPRTVCEPSFASTVHLPGTRDEIEAVVTVLPWNDDQCILTASPEQEARLAEWLRRSDACRHARAFDATAAFAMLELCGPRRNALLSALASTAGIASDGETPSRTGWAGSSPVRMFRDGLNDSTLLLVPSDGAAYLWGLLMAAGAAFGLRVGGYFAHEAMRIRRGVPAFGREASPARHAHELGFFPVRTGDSDASSGLPHTHHCRTLTGFSSPSCEEGFGAREVVLCQGEVIGEITSRARLPGWPLTLALGLVDPRRWQGQSLETVVGGRRWPLDVRKTAWGASVES